VVARFAGTLGTPLAELALLAPFAEYDDAARLDLTGALLSPLLARLGATQAFGALAKGPMLVASDVLPPFAGSGGRSAAALRIIPELLASPAFPCSLLAEERAAFSLVMTLPDRAEGLRAFREKRAPRFDW